MAIKVKEGKYKCFFCGEEYNTDIEADKCVLEHNLIYVPMTEQELNQFIMYIYELRDPPMQLIQRLKNIQKDRAGK